MPRYIDADKFKSHLEKAMEKMHIIAGVKAVDVGAVIKALDMQPTDDAVPRAELDILKSTITHKEEEAYNKGYKDAKADILEKLQADIARDEILAEYGDEFFEGRIAGFKAVINYILSEDEE